MTPRNDIAFKNAAAYDGGSAHRGAAMYTPITNSKCQIYHSPNLPPAAPDVADVPCILKPDWAAGQEGGDRGTLQLVWTHIMLIDATVDIRDSYAGAGAFNPQGDIAYIPESTSMGYTVIFIEVIQPGTPNAHKRVYLDRQQPTWPTNDL
jgi:hypothetical protein